MQLRKILFGSEGGLMNSDLCAMMRRNKLSDYLPYTAYDPKTSMYINSDQTIGFIWECTPLVYAGKHTFEILEGIFNMGLPAASVLQFMLYADPHILPYTNRYEQLKTRRSGLIKRVAEKTIAFYEKGARKGFEKLQGIPARNFRLFVSLKLPTPAEHATALDLKNNIGEILAGAHLCPALLSPNGLIEMLMRLLNDKHPQSNSYYDETVPIRKQIIFSETPVVSAWDRMALGKKHFGCLTVKKMAQFVDFLTFNHVLGDIWGVQSDGSQINNPFFLTVNVIFDPLKTQLHGKCNFVLQQHGVGSLAPSLKRKQEEYMWATDEIEKGTEFVRIMPILWHITPSVAESKEAAARIKRIWESRGFIMQEDKGILTVLFLSALPLGMYNVKNSTVQSF